MVTVTMESTVAHAVLRKLGWRQDATCGRWVSPAGERFWLTDEAVCVAMREYAGPDLRAVAS